LNKTKTTEEFIKEAIKVHGKKYDYSEAAYLGFNEPITIICKQHGRFLKLPTYHTSKGSGCLPCAKESMIKAKSLTQEQILAKFEEKHGSRYDYSKVKYAGYDKKVIIGCKFHGNFSQAPSNHISGNGCKKCSQISRMKTLEQFIDKAEQKHGTKYDYSQSNYEGSSQKIIIICKLHGEFNQIPYDHECGHGCPTCANDLNAKNATLDTKEIIQRFKEKHGSRYDYSLVKYTKYHSKVTVTCLVHGDFYPTPANHINGTGCKKCARMATLKARINKQISEEYNFAAMFPKKAKMWHPTKNKNIKPDEFLPMSNQKAHWQCKFGHEFFVPISSVARSKSNGCSKCSHQTSAPEVRILAECEYIFSEVLSRFHIEKNEIDVYIPELKIGIEYDGSYWHKSKEKKDKKKNKFLKEKNISLIRVREFPLNKIDKNDICVSQDKIIKEDIDRIFEIINSLSKKQYDDEIKAYISSDSFFNEKLYKTYLSFFPSPLPQNALSRTHKDLSMEWDYEKNDPLKPENFTSGSRYKAWWLCTNKNHPSFDQQITSRAGKGDSCPYCSHQKVIFEESIKYLHPKIAREWHYDLNDKLPEEIPENSGYVAWWICPLKGCEYQKVVRHRTIKKQDCTECFGIKNRKSHKQHIPGHGNKYSQSQIDFFENGLSHLKSYLKQHNDIYNMTISFVCKDGFRLGGWVNKQISKKNTMSKERFNILNSLSGWTWSKGNDFAFEKGIKYLIQYLEIHLSMDEMKSNHLAPDGYTLGRWVSKKRAQRDTMRKKRRKALESVKGWDWNNPRKPKET